jgi:cell division protein FtsN
VARHRKKKALHTRSARKRSAFPKGLVWLVGLFLMVLGFAGIYHLYSKGQAASYHPLGLQSVPDDKHRSAKKPPVPVEKRRTSPKTRRQAGPTQSLAKQEAAQRFEFYQLLPGLEVPLPDPITPSPTVSRPLLPTTVKSHDAAPPTPKKGASSKTKSVPVYSKQAAARYMIQAKAYRHRERAEQLKNRLIGLGFKARNQEVEAEDGTWFRVMVGPFASESMATEQKKRLQRHQIHGILILQR